MLLDFIHRYERAGYHAEAGNPNGSGGTTAANGSITIDPGILCKTSSGASGMTQAQSMEQKIAPIHTLRQACALVIMTSGTVSD